MVFSISIKAILKTALSASLLLISILNCEAQLISLGDSWKYFDLGSEPLLDGEGDDWKSLNFNDSLWAMGNAHMGYGDGDEQTVLANPIITAYFRKTVNISDPSVFTDILLQSVYDDGIIVYLNDVEVLRMNMPTGPVNYNTTALGGSSDNATVSKTLNNALLAGDNIIAVEVHNRSLTSSDLSFDLSMDVNLETGGALIREGSIWQYYDLENEPPDQSSTCWQENGYDDSTWVSGRAHLGYGDGDETTVVNADAQTIYLRKDFDITDISIFEYLEMNITFDDGAVVYLNGTEVWRVNMPTGSIDYNTFAASTSSENEMATTTISNALVSGTNTLAVELHQRSATSSDLSFDFSLKGSLKDEVPFISFNEAWSYDDQDVEPASQTGTTWKESAYDDSTWSSGNAELGYGDGDETTVLNASTHTAYFRKSLNIENTSLYDSTILNMKFDDGAIVYINGSEVWRVNMPGGIVTHNTNAISPNENQMDSFVIANNLINGVNTIAVEVHQESIVSDDLSFDLSVKGKVRDKSTFIDYGAGWSYFDNLSEPPGQGAAAWSDFIYQPDASWDSGPAQLGYGDADEATVIDDQTETAYFRKSFNIPNTSFYSGLEISLVYDDGAIIYLNGFEVMRVNMPSGTVDYNTVASSNSGDNAVISGLIDNLLVSDTNHIAVEIHQRSTSSSDISFDLRLEGIIAKNNSSIIRGPYLQSAAEDRVTIKWRTNIPTESILDFGSATSNLTSTSSDLIRKTDHELEITGLNAETVYYYQIRDNAGTLKEAASNLYFKTHPIIGTEKPMTAWILGDCGTGNNNARAVRDAYYNYIGSNHTDMILFLGDNAYTDGTDEEYQSAIFQDMYEDKLQNTIAWSCLGNHDGHSANSSTQTGPYYDIFTFPTTAASGGMASGTEAYYSFDYGNVHFIVLDSYDSDRSIGGAMYNWCQSDIQNTSAKWIIAFWHHPPYTKGSHNSDSEGALIEMRQRFLPLLENNGVDLVLSGHSHSYERSYYLNGHYGDSDSFDSATHTIGSSGFGDGQPNSDGAYRQPVQGTDVGKGAVYITTGSAGKTSSGSLDHEAMFYSVSSLGSCVLEINQDSLNVKFLRETGTVEDKFTIIKCRGLETVVTDADTGEGSLRQMINDACPMDTIVIAPAITNPIILQSEVILDKSLIIKGTDITSTISGNGTNRIFNIFNAIPIELMNLNLQNSSENTDGGALLNGGILTLKNVTFQNNYEGASRKSLTNNGEIIIKNNTTTTIKE